MLAIVAHHWPPCRGLAGCRGLEVRQRVDPDAVTPDHAVPHLEVEVRAGGVAGHPDPPDLLRSTDMLTDMDKDRRHVVVRGEQAAPVRDPDLVAAAVVLP